MQGQCVHRARQLLRKSTVDFLVSGHLAHTGEDLAHLNNAKMRLRIRRHAMLITFVGDLQVYGREALQQVAFDFLLHCHAVVPFLYSVDGGNYTEARACATATRLSFYACACSREIGLVFVSSIF